MFLVAFFYEVIRLNSADITNDSCPRLAAGVRLKFDDIRKSWTILAPERVFMLDEIAGEILLGCDGKSFSELIDFLLIKFNAPRLEIEKDVKEVLANLVVKGVLDI